MMPAIMNWPSQTPPRRDWELRRLSDADVAAIAGHWRALPSGARYKRFGHILPDATLERFAEDLDFSTDLFCGAFSPEGDLVGLSQAAPEWDGTWELSFSVLPGVQRKGIARRLGERLLRMLAAQNVRRVRLCCLASNQPMTRLADQLGFSLQRDNAFVRGERELVAPNVRGLRPGQSTRLRGG
jgi:RimJ/RimL family protein N-acetyltransferase